jgi:glycine/sarcosine N-methyltransferase
MAMSSPTQHFYDHFADDYHLIFADWRASVLRQGDILDQFIRRFGEAQTVLDCSCGIGTQAIGLAARGYAVHATDLSPAAVKRAAAEAEKFDVKLNFGVADMRRLDESVPGTFDVVLSFDNSWAHLLTDDDLYAAARSMNAKVKPGGLLMVSIRDYDRLALEKPTHTDPLIYDDPGGKRIFFQVWDWSADGRSYTLHHTIMRETDGDWQVTHGVTTLRALQRQQISAALNAAGLQDVQWHTPEGSGFYQPVVTGRKVI